jgi:hypothetical protein
MAKDDDFIEKFEKQIDLLRNLEKAVQDAIGRARKKLADLKSGKDIEEVFPDPPEK